jgi:hypothetical protein
MSVKPTVTCRHVHRTRGIGVGSLRDLFVRQHCSAVDVAAGCDERMANGAEQTKHAQCLIVGHS